MGRFHYWYWQSMMPVPVLAFFTLVQDQYGHIPLMVMACPYRYWHCCILVQYQYGHGPLPELVFSGVCTGIGIFTLWFSTSMGIFHYWYWHYMVPVPLLTFVDFDPVPVSARYITGTGIKWCLNQYWHFCTFVQYQYGYGKLPLLALNGASTGIGIYAYWSSTSIGTVPYRYWH